MKGVIFSVVAILVTAAIADMYDDGEINVQILNSNVPNIDYELKAAQTLRQAFILYPDDHDKRLQAFALLFNDSHPTADGWKVSEGCTGFYNPVEHYFVSLNVTSDSIETVVKIFD